MSSGGRGGGDDGEKLGGGDSNGEYNGGAGNEDDDRGAPGAYKADIAALAEYHWIMGTNKKLPAIQMEYIRMRENLERLQRQQEGNIPNEQWMEGPPPPLLAIRIVDFELRTRLALSKALGFIIELM